MVPFLGVRVVSINDNYDSDNFSGQAGGIEVAFKNLVYNMYSRDLSQKVQLLTSVSVCIVLFYHKKFRHHLDTKALKIMPALSDAICEAVSIFKDFCH